MVKTGANPDLHRLGSTQSVALGLAGTVAPNLVMGALTALASRPQVPELVELARQFRVYQCTQGRGSGCGFRWSPKAVRIGER
ncbi:hypothetical protein [Thiocapsa marina]|uniref:Uncharacterized protein n=1 Tax=Thiocapsa marina 5811 TaxID=768671 RepID=F9UE80_9GAMM|nr:hypothetical protein [Thiocapsa marina]EGV17637.1 hypothetical protein ThimaDRAFT_3182 [Thiocapsa marina 5811]